MEVTAAPARVEELAAANGKRIGVATLDSPKTLNALSLEMIRILTPQLEAWAADPNIACVVLRGDSEKAFCAGGDVKRIREAILESPGQLHDDARDFFTAEYRLDYLIHTYPKPFLCWGHGFVMGGGMGLMQGASHRVVTETTRISMPEIVIGLYPDVGATWFLNRVPGRLGLFLGLTAAQVSGSDALMLGFADWLLPNDSLASVLDALTRAEWTSCTTQNHGLLSQVLRAAQLPEDRQPDRPIGQRFDAIRALCLADSLGEFADGLAKLAENDPWYGKLHATLVKGSPTTAHLVWKLHRRRSHLSLRQAFHLELILSCQCSLHPDFPEGIRALLVDRDNQPKWSPASIDAVTDAWIDEHFTPPWTGAAPDPFVGLPDV
jgi:enoyl-CoA hydratase/carnithine racemase